MSCFARIPRETKMLGAFSIQALKKAVKLEAALAAPAHNLYI